MIRFIGDIHGNFRSYNSMVLKSGQGLSIQVGDFGFGFGDLDEVEPYGPNYVIRGNHDDPSKFIMYDRGLQSGANSLNIRTPDGGWKDLKMFVISGAYSTDRHLRVEGRDWWSNEEHSITDLNALIDEYEKTKPDLVVSHDCPQQALSLPELRLPNRTSQALSAMFALHQPKLWVFGHYHQSIDHQVGATRFICVDSNTYKDVEL